MKCDHCGEEIKDKFLRVSDDARNTTFSFHGDCVNVAMSSGAIKSMKFPPRDLHVCSLCKEPADESRSGCVTEATVGNGDIYYCGQCYGALNKNVSVEVVGPRVDEIVYDFADKTPSRIIQLQVDKKSFKVDSKDDYVPMVVGLQKKDLSLWVPWRTEDGRDISFVFTKTGFGEFAVLNSYEWITEQMENWK